MAAPKKPDVAPERTAAPACAPSAPGPEDTFRGHRITRHDVRIAGRRFELIGPADSAGLAEDPRVIDRFERDEYLPYWADLWPSSLLLAEHLLVNWSPPSRAVAGPQGRPHLLDLGCGLGLAGIAGATAGLRVTLGDYDDDALAFAMENARRNGLSKAIDAGLVEAQHVDWRESYPNLRVDVLVAADVLYETRGLAPLAEFIRRHLRPDGVALIADPNRSTAPAFDAIARHSGLTIEAVPLSTLAGSGRVEGTLYQLRRAFEAAGDG